MNPWLAMSIMGSIILISCLLPNLIYEFKLMKKYYRKGKWLEKQVNDFGKGEWVLDPEDNTSMIQHKIMINCNIIMSESAKNLNITDCSLLDCVITKTGKNTNTTHYKI